MDTGDAVLLPRGGTHDVVSQPDLACRDVTAFTTSALCQGVSALTACKTEERSASHVLIFSACMEFDLGAMGSLVGLMPEVMFVGTLSERYPEILPILEAMERETCGERAGFAGILAHLANVVAAFIVRAWVESGMRRGERLGVRSARPAPRRRDFCRPSRPRTGLDGRGSGRGDGEFTVDLCGTVSGRHRFDAVRYLTELRMRLAAEWIGRDRMPIDVAAHRLGYGSQAAFSRAFKRTVGRSPGSVRAARA